MAVLLPAQRNAISLLCISVIWIALLGIYNLQSAAASFNERLYLVQSLWLFLGIGISILLALIGHSRLCALSYVVFSFVILSLLAVLFVGSKGGGAQRWLDLGFYRFQPSEPAKLAVILVLAHFFSRRVRVGGHDLVSLLRPLNISRPLVLLGMLILFWNSEYLVDPLGVLSRGITSVTSAPLQNSVRAMLLGLTLCTIGLVVAYRLIRNRPGLGPALVVEQRWSRFGWVFSIISLIVGMCFLVRITPLFGDPIYTCWRYLKWRAELPPVRSYGMRVVLTITLVAYVLLSIWATFKAKPTWKRWVAPADLIALPALLILVEPDLGTAGVVLLVGASIVLFVGLRWIDFWISIGAGAAVSVLGFFAVLKPYQRERILTFLNPENDLRGSGWNATQSLIAIGSGGWWGKGHGAGTQTQLSFLPERHTDFAFSVWAEEQGLMGVSLLLLGYGLLMWSGLQIAEKAEDNQGAIVAYGCVALFFWHTVINLAMVMGLAPVVGLTLPLFSYGGSSMLTFMVALGLLLSVGLRR